jgi:hypothetical protein
MYRRFDFEGAIHASLDCVPLTVRRKLDLAGLKISLAGWQSLAREERLALCHLPADTEDDLLVYREVMRGFAARAGAPLSPIEPLPSRDAWSAGEVSARLVDRLGREQAPDERRLLALTEEERYALVKLAEPKRDTGKLRLLLGELGLPGGAVAKPPAAACG